MWNSGYSRVATDDLEDDTTTGIDENDAADDYRLRLVTVCAIAIIVPVLFLMGKAFLW